MAIDLLQDSGQSQYAGLEMKLVSKWIREEGRAMDWEVAMSTDLELFVALEQGQCIT